MAYQGDWEIKGNNSYVNLIITAQRSCHTGLGCTVIGAKHHKYK